MTDRTNAGVGQKVPPADIVEVPDGQVAVLSVLAGGVNVSPERGIYVFVSESYDGLDPNTPNGPGDKGINPNTAAVNMNNARTSVSAFATGGQYIAWNVFHGGNAAGTIRYFSAA